MKRKRGRAQGAAMMIWLFFANLFDPAKIALTDQVADRTRAAESARPTGTATASPGDEG